MRYEESPANIEDRFACFGEIRLQAPKVVAGFQLRQFGGSHRAADVAGEEAPDLPPLKRFGAGELHTRSFPKALAITAGVPSGNAEGLLKLRLRDPGDAARIVRGAKRSTRGAAQVIHQHVVIFRRAGVVEHDALVNFEQFEDLDFEAGLFAHFTPERFFEPLAGFDNATRQRPPVFEGFAPALDEKDAAILHDQRTNAENGPFRVAAANTVTLP